MPSTASAPRDSARAADPDRLAEARAEPALSRLALHHVTACLDGLRRGYRTARTDLDDCLPPQAIEALLAAYRAEGAKLAATARAVELVDRVLRGGGRGHADPERRPRT